MKQLESQIQKSILEYLALKGYFHWRNNSGGFKNDKGHFFRFGAVGSPDVFLLHKGILWGIEVKTDKGTVSDAQKAFGALIVNNGGNYLVARSIDDVIKEGL